MATFKITHSNYGDVNLEGSKFMNFSLSESSTKGPMCIELGSPPEVQPIKVLSGRLVVAGNRGKFCKLMKPAHVIGSIGTITV